MDDGDDESSGHPRHRKKAKRCRPSYFSKFSFEEARKVFEDFLAEDDEWDPQEEQPFFGTNWKPKVDAFHCRKT